MSLTIEPAASRFEAGTQRLMTSGLPASVKALILACLRQPGATPDHLLVLADALDEIASLHSIDGLDPRSWQTASGALVDLAQVMRQ